MRSIFVVCIALILFVTPAWAFFEDRMYCRLSSDSIFVTLEPQWLYKCDEYIAALNNAIKDTAQEVLIIQEYIQQWDDGEYRQEVRATLRDRIFRLQAMKNDIVQAMQVFDQWLFDKVSQALQVEIQNTMTNITYEHALLSSYTGDQEAIQNRAERIAEQLTIIEQMKQADTFEILIPLFSRYLYLQRTIQWQLES